MKLIEANPAIQQRDMAKAMGVSLGKANYCLQALVQKGLVKMDNFRRNDNKLAYSYLLTPSGIEEKASLTISFLKYKVAEYDAIRSEIEELRRDAERDATA
ncbi:MAG: MarR family EPS-associated transcriptional regulator [Sulfuritalea sp.]|nr:MarR family EPS-associated transcriptional regulator [Sulfuritalea sp.]